ncbi:MAG: D-tyrosyl-tRNA(Tyr) deacylase [Spirochaetales bacterium]|nr:D-tyrosyl-tRNA(Tyr) deacylase [Spirochaetales bacterium]
MKAVIQRVRRAHVAVDQEIVGSIEHGLLVYLGIGKGDTQQNLSWLCNKIVKLRVFADEAGKMNKALGEVGGQLLVVSQFTLLANLHKGNRPSYDDAADPKEAEVLYEAALDLFRSMGFVVAGGRFGSHMDVSYTNDGPVTFVLEA